MTEPKSKFTTLGGVDPRSKMPHKQNCRKCRYGTTWSGGTWYCDYYCKNWDETGVPQRRPYPAETCPLWKRKEPKARRRQPR